MENWQAIWRRWQQIDLLLLRATTLFIFFCASWYWRPRWMLKDWAPAFVRDGLNSPFDSSAYQEVSFARYALAPFIVFLLLLWVLSAFYGLRRVWRSGHGVWLALLLLLVLWVNLSVGWSQENEFVARSQSAQWWLVFFFVLIVICAGPKRSSISLALISGMLLQAAIGIAQSAVQHDIGIIWIDDSIFKIGLGLYEFDLDPAVSGVSVIQAEGVRFLRAYGLTPHPNLLAPVLVMGILNTVWLWQKHDRRITAIVTTLGLWALFLTFSRASLGGLGLGFASIIVMWVLARRFQWEPTLAWLGLLLIVGASFYVIYSPLIAVRAGAGSEGKSSLESMSVASRRIYEEQAREMIEDHPLQGVGIGNFAWVSHEMLRDRPEIDLQGNNVHNVYYLAAAEVGLIGMAIIALLAFRLVFGLWRALPRLELETLALSGAVVAWLAIAFYEFYFWVIMPYQVLFWGMVAALAKGVWDGNDSITDMEDTTHL